MRKFISILLIFILSISAFNINVFADDTKAIVAQINNPQLKIDGEEVYIDDNGTTPVIVDGRTLLPIRAIIEQMGGNVYWDGDSYIATITYSNNEIKLVMNSNIAYVNSKSVEIDTQPVIINGRTMLPLRFVAESFGFDIEWDPEYKTITISNNSKSQEDIDKDIVEDVDESTVNESKSLVVYFSQTGTTEKIANDIKTVTNSDIVKLEPVNEYTQDYSTLLDIAQNELNQNARPEIKDIDVDLSNYNTIYIGYPIWWGTMPMLVLTFVENNDFSGKTIVPFCTSGSSSISTSQKQLENKLIGSNVKKGMRFDNSTSADDIKNWIDSIK